MSVREPSDDEKEHIVDAIMEAYFKGKKDRNISDAIMEAYLKGKRRRNIQCPKCGHIFNVE